MIINKTNADKNEWTRNTIRMLDIHKYYTDYCRNSLENNKQANLEKLKKKNPLLSLTPASITSLLENKINTREIRPKEAEKKRIRKVKRMQQTGR